MKKSQHLGEGAGGSGNSIPLASARPFAFRIVRFEHCEYGSKKAILTIEIDQLGALTVEYFAPEGKPAFVAGGSTRSAYSGRFERHCELDPDFADELRFVIESRISAESTAEIAKPA